MFCSVKLKQILLVIVIIVSLVLVALLISTCETGQSAETYGACAYTLVIDPGHGGIDGGAVSADGRRESAINLAIGQKMSGLADFFGYPSVMTRLSEESDVSIGEYSERGELLRRAQMANDTPNAVLISVHQNKFPTPEPTGAEVMYAATEGSRLLGEAAQKNLVSFADPQNRRVSTPAPSKLLLTSSVTCPAILAECGFMSNPGEVERLSTDEYQLKIACALLCAYIEFTQSPV